MIFMGTPDFAVPALCSLDDNFDVIGVFTQPDKKVGRKQIITPPDVKVEAKKRNIDVFQPESMKSDEVFEMITAMSPDVIVVAAYGKILPKRILDIPKLGCINIHASLLPKYRGAAPIQWSVINGDEYTGVTVMQMAEGLDTGDMLYQKKVRIGINDTASDVFDSLSELGAQMVVEYLNDVNSFEPVKQDDDLSTYAKMLDKSISEIDFTMSAFKVHKLICGLYSWPIAQTVYHGKRLKIYKSRLSDLRGEPGCVVSLDPLTVACGDKSIEILEMQLEGKKRMDSKAFLQGHKIDINEQFGGK